MTNLNQLNKYVQDKLLKTILTKLYKLPIKALETLIYQQY